MWKPSFPRRKRRESAVRSWGGDTTLITAAGVSGLRLITSVYQLGCAFEDPRARIRIHLDRRRGSP